MNKRAGNITGEQKTLMLEFLGAHPDMVSSKFTATFTFKTAQILWKELAEILNAVPGACKDWSQWRKTWHDIRTKTKSKKAALIRSCEKTGGGPPSKEIMSPNEQQVVNLIGSTTILGDPTTEESYVAFSFEDDPAGLMEFSHGQSPSENIADGDSQNWPIETITSTSHNRLVGSGSTNRVLKQSIPQQKVNRIEILLNEGSKTRPRASQRRLDETIRYTKAMMESSMNELETRKAYYNKKLELQERDVLAKEQIAKAISRYCSVPELDTEEEFEINDVEYLDESLLE